MTVETLIREDTQENLPLNQMREKLNAIGGWTPEAQRDPLTDPRHNVENVGTPIWDEMVSRFHNMSNEWWDERWQAIELQLRDDIECEYMETLADDILNACVSAKSEDESIVIEIKGIDPNSIDLPDNLPVEYNDDNVVSGEIVNGFNQFCDPPPAPPVANQIYTEEYGWIEKDRVRKDLGSMVRKRSGNDETQVIVQDNPTQQFAIENERPRKLLKLLEKLRLTR